MIKVMKQIRDFLVYAQDIKKLKYVEEALRESEERYRRVVELSPIGIFIHDGNRVEFVNVAGIELLGAKSAEELIGKPVLDGIHPMDKEDVRKKLHLAREKGGFTPLKERKFIRMDGSEANVEVTTTLFPYKGKNMFLTFARDITERKQAEFLQKTVEENTKLLSEALEYDIVKMEFFSNISHELRTPLNVILASLQLLYLMPESCVDEANREKYYKYLYMMKQNGNRLLRLINNLIDITKIDSGYFQIRMENHNIVNIIENITLSVAEYIENKGISLIFDTDVEEKIMACDPDSMERIMLNLLSNAVKFTRTCGSIQVNIEDQGETVQISVKDTGIGIPTDKQKIIFERFRQVDKSLTRNHEGSGIGLSIVKSLVEMQGGTIFVKSEENRGSEFIMQFPVRILQEDEIMAEKENSTGQSMVERVRIEFSDIYA
ncbi:PAS domain-containing sensor histidine kinase [Thermotalea metallivorans]|uniref:histidine kinase n=1 Tax=Thermotalea metallivorans TaxID=520762 RepID=A0A140LA85_9FIRM|nr:PAS domain-containing sensor histidine kinase [Thermotalea metallivorans]KXG77460.1 Sensor histidine kinase TmoS [Thermotalea metallivorans]